MKRLLLVIALLSGGCASPVDPALRREVDAIGKAWPIVRDSSAPAPGVGADSHARLTAAMDRAVSKAQEAAHAQ